KRFQGVRMPGYNCKIAWTQKNDLALNGGRLWRRHNGSVVGEGHGRDLSWTPHFASDRRSARSRGLVLHSSRSFPRNSRSPRLSRPATAAGVRSSFVAISANG